VSNVNCSVNSHLYIKTNKYKNKATGLSLWLTHRQEEVCHQVLLARHRHQNVYAATPEMTHESAAKSIHKHILRALKKNRPLLYENQPANVGWFSCISLLNSERICGGSWNTNNYLPSTLLPHDLVKCKITVE